VGTSTTAIFSNGMVNRHAMIFNPALYVRGERYEAVTSEIAPTASGEEEL
jgi:hypothetical protein